MFTDTKIYLAQSLKPQPVLGEGFLNAHVSIANILDSAMKGTLRGIYPRAVELAQAISKLALFFPWEMEYRDTLWQGRSRNLRWINS